MAEDEAQVDRWVARYPEAEMTSADFEAFVTELLSAGEPGLEDFTVTSHEKIESADGTYDFDTTVRFRCLGMDFLVLVEAKCHTDPIKRELVQVLYAKAQSVGAHKAVLISKSPFQRGAIKFAMTHGIALVMVTEGRFTYITRAATQGPPLTREEAFEAHGIPIFVGVHCGPGDEPDSTMISVVGADDAKRIQELLLGMIVSPE